MIISSKSQYFNGAWVFSRMQLYFQNNFSLLCMEIRNIVCTLVHSVHKMELLHSLEAVHIALNTNYVSPAWNHLTW